MDSFPKQEFLTLLEKQIQNIDYLNEAKKLMLSDRQREPFIQNPNVYLPYVKVMMKVVILEHFHMENFKSFELDFKEEQIEGMKTLQHERKILMMGHCLSEEKTNHLIEVIITRRVQKFLLNFSFFKGKEISEQTIFVKLNLLLYGKNISKKCYSLIRKKFKSNKRLIESEKAKQVFFFDKLFFKKKSIENHDLQDSFSEDFMKNFLKIVKNPEEGPEKIVEEKDNGNKMNEKTLEIVKKVEKLKEETIAEKKQDLEKIALQEKISQIQSELFHFNDQYYGRMQNKPNHRRKIFISRQSVRAWKNNTFEKDQIRKAVEDYRLEILDGKKDEKTRVSSMIQKAVSVNKQSQASFKIKEIQIPLFVSQKLNKNLINNKDKIQI